jgi:hypothetical protein
VSEVVERKSIGGEKPITRLLTQGVDFTFICLTTLNSLFDLSCTPKTDSSFAYYGIAQPRADLYSNPVTM